MTYRFSALITADGNQAKAEMKATAKEAGAVTRALDKVSAKGRGTTAVLDAMGAEAKQSATEMNAIAAAGQRAAAGAQGIVTQSRAGTAAIGNLTAQGNDLIVMTAAMQNPLQMAIQQGTQIGQVFQQSGVQGRDALKMLGSSVATMLSPINLITIGSIAAGAVMYQWFRSGQEEAVPFKDALSGLSDAVKSYAEASKDANVVTEDMRQKFGAAAAEARLLLDKLTESARRQLQFDIKATITATIDESSIDAARFDIGDQKQIADLFDLSLFGFDADVRREQRTVINAVLRGYADLARAADGSVAQQIAALERLRDSFETGALMSGGISEEENAQLRNFEQLILRLYEIRGELPDETRIAATAKAAWNDYYASRIASEAHLANAQEVQRATLADIFGYYAQTRQAATEQENAARETLQALSAENDMHRLALRHGQDSVVVANAEADARRRALEEELATLDVAESLKDERRAALEDSIALSQVDASAIIAAAADQANRMANEIERALNGMMSLSAQGISSLRESEIRLEYRDDPVGRAGALAAEKFGDTSGFDRQLQPELERLKAEYIANAEATEVNRQALIAWQKQQTEAARAASRAGKSSSSEIERQRGAVAKLIQTQERELAILRETDPVQQELLRHREILAHATDAQRAAVEGLIATRLKEEQQMQQLTERQEFFGDASLDALDSLILRGEDAADVMDALKNAIARAALQAIWLGQGPLAGLFGGGDGGLFGMLVGAVTGKKDGGQIYGAGGPRDDKQLIAASPGEYIVNAKATALNLPLLEALNAGAFPRYRNGGQVMGAGGGRSRGDGPGDRGDRRMSIEVLPSPLFDVRVRETADRSTAQGLRSYDANVAPSTVRRVQADPRGRGR